ncbi:MAG: glycosyltransferase family 2 protein [Methylotenera sp.]|nr:glycosyltransferase family 2 protein [Oligoflexia bacterium]
MISGFTLVRNGTQFGYPYLESLRSLLPLVDELVINVGMGDDDTWITLQKFAEHEGQGKVRLFESEWPLNDPEKRRGGLILSEQTNLALDRCKGDWCVYLQADEILHEADYPALRSAFATYADDSAVEGLLFDYVHFYGSFDVIQHSRSAYRREVRVVKKSSGARSVGDAQSFRKNDGSKLKVVHAGASIHHYGWVRPPEVMKEKTVFMDQLYHGKKAETAGPVIPQSGDNYRYKKIWGLRPFRGVHPQVMQKRISEKKWNWNLKDSPLEWKWSDSKKVVLDTLERITGYRFFEYRSYRLTTPGKPTSGSSR